MREYLLFSQIPNARERQVLSILAGVTASQPRHVWQQVLLYGQVKQAEEAVSKKAPVKQHAPTQVQPLHYHRLVRDLTVDDSGTSAAGPWTFRAEALPDAGLTECIARSVEERQATEDDLRRVKQPHLYRFRRHFLTHANRFVHKNVVVRIYRLLQAPDTADLSSSAAPSPKDQKLLDDSGSCIVEVSIRVEDANNSALTDKAKQELLAFKDTMDGVLDLIAPDRLALDTRVKNA